MKRVLSVRRLFLTTVLALVQGGFFIAGARAEAAETRPDEPIRESWKGWNAPFKPFRIIGNVYYVGAAGVSSFLITTSEGHILLDTGFDVTVPRITNSVSKLGFRLRDVKIILCSHAHLDHTGGHALMKSLTGAKICISEAEAPLLASGGASDSSGYSTNMTAYPPAAADRLLRDGDTVKLGGTVLTCHLTPGHTKGCTTWTMDVEEGAKRYHVLFFGSTSLLEEVKLLGNPEYPNMAEDFTTSFKKLKALPCDVFLAPHASFFKLAEKAERLARGETPNPFIDSQGYRAFVTKSEGAFQERLQQETRNVK